MRVFNMISTDKTKRLFLFSLVNFLFWHKIVNFYQNMSFILG